MAAVALGAVLAERSRCESLVRQYIRFDSNQQHLHSWHSLQDCLEKIRRGEAPFDEVPS